MLLRGEQQINAINSKFENFESALYMKSVSMPLKYKLTSKTARLSSDDSTMNLKVVWVLDKDTK